MDLNPIKCLNFDNSDLVQAHDSGLAVFDFDKTITYHDSFIEFLFFIEGGEKKLILKIIKNYCLFFYTIKYYFGFISNEEIVELYLHEFFKSQNVNKVNDMIQQFQEHLNATLNNDALHRIKWHKQQKHLVVIVSATPDILLIPFCEKNNLKLIASKLEVKEQMYTGNFHGSECNGKEKVQQIKKRLGPVETFRNIYAYGDDKLDIPMLTLAPKCNQFYRANFKKLRDCNNVSTKRS